MNYPARMLVPEDLQTDGRGRWISFLFALGWGIVVSMIFMFLPDGVSAQISAMFSPWILWNLDRIGPYFMICSATMFIFYHTGLRTYTVRFCGTPFGIPAIIIGSFTYYLATWPGIALARRLRLVKRR